MNEQQMLQIVQKFGDLIKDNNLREARALYNSLNKEERELFNNIAIAITLFTGASVSTVRDPSLFDNKKNRMYGKFISSYSKISDEFNSLGIILNRMKPSQENYVFANQLLSKAKDLTGFGGTKKIYRGLGELEPNVYLDLCKPGSEWNLGDIVSTTADYEVGQSFSEEDDYYSILLEITNPKMKGIYVDQLSVFPGEYEVILGGRVRVDSVRWKSQDGKGGYTSWDDLVKRVTEIQNDADEEGYLVWETYLKCTLL